MTELTPYYAEKLVEYRQLVNEQKESLAFAKESGRRATEAFISGIDSGILLEVPEELIQVVLHIVELADAQATLSTSILFMSKDISTLENLAKKEMEATKP